jgi:multidrug efflux pump subunit AcrB
MSGWYYKKLYYFVSRTYLRLLSIFVPIILLIASFVFLSPIIGFTLFPATDNNIITLRLTGPN